MPNVAICIPSRDSWAPEFGMSLMKMVASTQSYATKMGLGNVGMTVRNRSSSLVHSNRQNLAEWAMAQSGMTHVLFMDDDMAYPADTLVSLLSRDVPVCAVNYVCREYPPKPLAFDVRDGERIYHTEESKGVTQVSAVGTGIMLIKREVFEALPKPWFDTEWKPKDDGSSDYMGEDIYFCRKANLAGFTTWIDNDISRSVGHHGYAVYTWEQCER